MGPLLIIQNILILILIPQVRAHHLHQQLAPINRDRTRIRVRAIIHNAQVVMRETTSTLTGLVLQVGILIHVPTRTTRPDRTIIIIRTIRPIRARYNAIILILKAIDQQDNNQALSMAMPIALALL